MQSENLLHIQRASKTYSGVPALLDVDLELRAGEVHALMGENGAGKSTLIKILAGVTPPDSAEIHVRGERVHIASPQAAFDHGLRFIHQELHAVPQLSAAENIFLGHDYPTALGVKVRWRRLYDMARETLGRLGITHIDPRTTMAHLSPGDQMLVNIAHAFVGDDFTRAGERALIYVMDEPTAALTGAESAQLFDVIGRLRARGSAVLYVSHRMDEIFQIADRVTVLRDGQLAGTRDRASVTPAEIILLMTGRELTQLFPPRMGQIGAEVVLDVQGVTTAAVNGISFTVKAGEIVGVTGLAGSGMGALLRALIGADRRAAGRVMLDGVPLKRGSPAHAWDRQVAYVPEERRSQGLVLSHSVSNNITLPQLKRLSRAGALLAHGRERATTRELSESVRLKARGPRQIVRDLSGGNQQKVVFARALARPPKLLLLGEPTRGVDIGAKLDIYRLIRQISAQGTAIVLASTDLPELIGMTDRILILRAGRLADVVPSAGETPERLLSRCYGDAAYAG
ncbi:MAG: sugar ABC transporter ATP-binding protein [Anaerolineae bacterium]|nr:MAG: ribose ABC transporter ATP-binding protein [Chloroflexi bacterium OLB13]MBW7879144.1 sugar ABC transporter ATP-binding protein [Anaerolineae bacterium]MEB2364596.1 sugar ABC transporter ATP-binding protein [Chloroflexota bacterium]GIK28321.1 MAG: ABC transporter ATP-binding protein [Chloroflexota bacterium]